MSRPGVAAIQTLPRYAGLLYVTDLSRSPWSEWTSGWHPLALNAMCAQSPLPPDHQTPYVVGLGGIRHSDLQYDALRTCAAICQPYVHERSSDAQLRMARYATSLGSNFLGFLTRGFGCLYLYHCGEASLIECVLDGLAAPFAIFNRAEARGYHVHLGRCINAAVLGEVAGTSCTVETDCFHL